jgi:hypothetical protein
MSISVHSDSFSLFTGWLIGTAIMVGSRQPLHNTSLMDRMVLMAHAQL